MIRIVRKKDAPEYQDTNDLGLHPNTIIICNGFGVNPITKALHMKFTQVHDEENPNAVISILPELRFTDQSEDEEFTEQGQIINVGYPTKESVKHYLKFDFDNSDVNLPENIEIATKAAIWLLLNKKWSYLNLWKEWAVEYNGQLIEVSSQMLA
ncbi:hypothetical protein V2605_03445 [Tenacibaculum maritimum]|uniref:hypothetical protein n=1 Tax=Tenacibaculum maritimum TaxID=107401 RepID=UPI0012E5FDF6|nr:hypothetical protein [Tenacibaculum maritimum]CAA0254817.1 hypothetical protein DPIF8902391_90089 [Tenacibaculum maritimum]